MRNATLDKLIWALIYGGLLTVGVGISVRNTLPGALWIALVLGLAATAAGGVLIWVRSRRRDDAST
jgi:hypothetical protein